MNTTEIINNLTQKIANNEVISPSEYLNMAMKLNLFIADEQAKLYELHQKVSQFKASIIVSGKSAAQAKAMVEATDDYRNYLTQKGRIEQVIEYIRLAKIQARITNDGEYRGFNN